MTNDHVGIGVRNLDVPHALDARPHGSGRAKHDQRANQREMRERRVNGLERALFDAFGDGAADGCEDAGEERQLFGPEVRPAIGNLAEKDRQEMRGGIDRSHDGVDEPFELLLWRRVFGHRGTDVLGDGREDVADDAGVEGALVREVVIDHRLVDACAAGDAIDGGGGKTVGPELVAGGGENARSGVGCGAFGSRH